MGLEECRSSYILAKYRFHKAKEMSIWIYEHQESIEEDAVTFVKQHLSVFIVQIENYYAIYYSDSSFF